MAIATLCLGTDTLLWLIFVFANQSLMITWEPVVTDIGLPGESWDNTHTQFIVVSTQCFYQPQQQ